MYDAFNWPGHFSVKALGKYGLLLMGGTAEGTTARRDASRDHSRAEKQSSK